MITFTREEAVDAVSDVMSDTCDMDVTFRDYAKAVVEWMADQGVVFQREPNAPCPQCGKPADTRSCAMGGCPLGADL